MELKGITCRIPLELHNRISGEIREMGSTMGLGTRWKEAQPDAGLPTKLYCNRKGKRK